MPQIRVGFLSNRKHFYTIVFLLLAALLIAGFGMGASRAPFTSPELSFTDASASGMQIVPASCPSTPDYTGQCDPVCPVGYSGTPPNCVAPPNTGGGGGGGQNPGDGGQCPIGYVVAAGQCRFSACPLGYTLSGTQCLFLVCPAGYNLVGNECDLTSCPVGFTLQGGSCIPPAAINFTNFSASNPNGGFSASGHLQVIPILVRSGSRVQLYWSVQNVASCSVVGNNGDAWNAKSSGTSGTSSAPITAQTTFTLTCAALPGATPATIQESQLVNIIPVFNEL